MTGQTSYRNILLFSLITIMTAGCGTQTQKEEPPAEPIRVEEGLLGRLLLLPDGRIMAMRCDLRLPEEIPQSGPPQPVRVRYSHDNGLTWTPPTETFSYPGKGIVGVEYLLLDEEDNIHVFAGHYLRLPKKDSSGFSQVLHNLSRDGGKTWTEPKPVDYGHPYTGAFNSAITLSDGRILFALSYSNDFQVDPGKCLAVYSDDRGESWQVGADDITVPAGEFPGHPGALEPVLVQLGDGRVWMIIRTQLRRFYEVFSSDGGETWTESSPTDFEAPNTPAGILKLNDGRLVFCWNDLSQYPSEMEGSGRQYLHIAISSDDGKTWSPSKLIARREDGELPNTNVAYPFLTETADNHLLVLYFRVGNREGVTWWRPMEEVLRLDPDWIEMSEE